MKTLSRKNFKRIHDIACETWKDKLLKIFGNKFALNKEIEFTDELYKEMRDACTSEQHKLFDEIFGKDVKDGWYIGTSKVNKENYLGYFVDGQVVYCIDWKGEWVTKFRDDDTNIDLSVCELATTKQIEERLSKYASETLGVKEGVSVTLTNIVKSCLLISGKILYHPLNNILYWQTETYDIVLFKDGKWCEVIEPKTYHIGQRFLRMGQTYILAQVSENQCAFIWLENGNRLREPHEVNEAYKITTDEIRNMCSNFDKVMTLID